jgi:hypothetical protein
LVDYNAYQRFPAETHEFALDKLTLIAQEAVDGSGGGGGGGGVDPGNFVPITGTTVNNPITGVLQFQNNAIPKNWQFGIVPGFGIDDMTLQPILGTEPGSEFRIILNDGVNLAWVYHFKDNGELILPTDYTAPDPNAAATVQYVLDQVGGPGAAFVPLAGTDPAEEITGTLEFLNSGDTMGLGRATGFTDEFGVYLGAGQKFLVSLEAGGQVFIFDEGGELLLPTIDYGLAADNAAASKKYVDDQLSGGGAFIPLAGTSPAEEVTGPIEFLSTTLSEKWTIQIFENDGTGTAGFQILSDVTNVDADFMVINGGQVLKWTADGSLGVRNAIPLATDAISCGAGDFRLKDGGQAYFENVGSTLSASMGMDLGNQFTLSSTQGINIESDAGVILKGNNVETVRASTSGTAHLSANGTERLATTTTADQEVHVKGGLLVDGVINAPGSSIAGGFIAAENLTVSGRLCSVGVSGIVNQSTWSEGDLIPDTRTLTAGDGLSGGGNLTANRTFNVDSTVIRTSGNQTLGGAKTFTSDILASSVTVATNFVSCASFAGVGVNLETGSFGLIVQSPSDMRLKKNIRANPYGIDTVMAMNPIQYEWNEDMNRPGTDVGFGAQELIEVLPEAVAYNEEKDEYGMKSNQIIPVLVKALQEQQAMIDSLTARLDAMGG